MCAYFTSLIKLPFHRYNFVWILAAVLGVTSCNKEPTVITAGIKEGFSVQGHSILKGGAAITLNGVNAMQTFGLSDPRLMNTWGVEIVREFIGNLREQPISGTPIQGSNGKWYHPLDAIVEQNRANDKVTLLCPFGWVNTSGERQLLTGLNPLEQPFYPEYKSKMQAIAAHFAGQSDVWIEVWNEPFQWNNENNYSHNLWLQSMNDMIKNLKEVAGFTNIIVVPGNAQGQSEEVLLVHASTLQTAFNNLVFDLHAYEKWLLNQSALQIQERLRRLRENNIPVIFGEIGVENVGKLLPVDAFLSVAKRLEIPVLGWLWNKNSDDKNALLTNEGRPNAHEENNFWGERFYLFLKGN